MKRIDVLDFGYVELLDHMGDDLAVVNAAKVSYNKEAKEFGDKEKKLLKFLVQSWPPHTSPLEQVVFKFRIKLPIFVMRELVRHRTARLNELSGRYQKLDTELYVPNRWRVQDTKNKQSSVDVENFHHGYWTESVRTITSGIFSWYHSMLEDGIARELARIVLPLNTYTTCIWQIDLNNAFKFLSLRNNPAAQWEIQEYARAIETLIAEIVPFSHQYWREEFDFLCEVMDNKDKVREFLRKLKENGDERIQGIGEQT